MDSNVRWLDIYVSYNPKRRATFMVNLDGGNFVVNTKAISEFMIILSIPHIAKIR